MRTLAPVLLLAGMLLPTGALAQSVTVAVNGSIRASTCAVTVTANGGANGTNGTVTLPATRTSLLVAANARAGRQPWAITVGSAANPCWARNVRVAFRNAGNVNAAGRLNNTGTAGNVNVAMINVQGGGNQTINLSNNTNSQTVALPASRIATLNFAAEYYATGRTTQGTVVTSVQYDITYP